MNRDASETVPLVHLASVRVAFERDERKLHWPIGLLVSFAEAVAEQLPGAGK